MAPRQPDDRITDALRWRDALEAVARDGRRDGDEAWHGRDHRGDPVPVERVLLLLDVLTCERCGHVPEPPRDGPGRVDVGPTRITTGAAPRAAVRASTAATGRAATAGAAGQAHAVGDLTAAQRHVPHKGSRWHNLWHLLHG